MNCFALRPCFRRIINATQIQVRTVVIYVSQPFKHPIRCREYATYGAEVASSTPPVRHLICFKQWTADMVKEIIDSAINLKQAFPDTRGIKLPLLNGAKILMLQEVNRPVQHMAVSKAASLLGANDVSIIDHLVWDQDYMGKVFSKMSDAIFVSTSTHFCVQRFADQSEVPVMCVHSRTHSSLQALATVMAIQEEFGRMEGLNIGYLGPPRQILNSLLLLCPLLKADIKFKCCCKEKPVSPLLYKTSEDMCSEQHTTMKACETSEEVFAKANVVIAGPASTKKDTKKSFSLKLSDIPKIEKWIFIHMCPRSDEVDDELFYHDFNRTFRVFENMQYIAAALMANRILGHNFEGPSNSAMTSSSGSPQECPCT